MAKQLGTQRSAQAVEAFFRAEFKDVSTQAVVAAGKKKRKLAKKRKKALAQIARRHGVRDARQAQELGADVQLVRNLRKLLN